MSTEDEAGVLGFIIGVLLTIVVCGAMFASYDFDVLTVNEQCVLEKAVEYCQGEGGSINTVGLNPKNPPGEFLCDFDRKVSVRFTLTEEERKECDAL